MPTIVTYDDGTGTLSHSLSSVYQIDGPTRCYSIMTKYSTKNDGKKKIVNGPVCSSRD